MKKKTPTGTRTRTHAARKQVTVASRAPGRMSDSEVNEWLGISDYNRMDLDAVPGMGPKRIRIGQRTSFYSRDEVLLFGHESGLHTLTPEEMPPPNAPYSWQMNRDEMTWRFRDLNKEVTK